VPFGFAKRALHTLVPSARGIVEFPVHCDACHPRALERVFTDAGFRHVTVTCSWDQAAYLQFLFPLFVAVLVHQRLAELARVRLLAAYAFVRATR
jgi:hypothetical protein